MKKIPFKDLPDMTTPLSSANLNLMQDNMEDAIIPIKLVNIGVTTPATATIGDMFYNTTDNKIYTATADNTWDSGSTPRYDGFYINTSDNTLFYYNGSTLIGVGGSGSGIGGDTLPVGMIMPSASQGSITDWLLCDGSAVSRTEYSELFSAIGVSYGSGDGSTTFNLPNIKGKMIIGYDADDTDFDSLGATGGSKTHILTTYELPKGAWISQDPNDGVHILVDSGNNYGMNTQSNQMGQPMDIMNPYIVLNYYIKSHKTAPVYATVKNEKTTSETDVYSCNYINNLVETITNANGTALKYADGTMICYGYPTVTFGGGNDYYGLFNTSNTMTINFPTNFISSNDLIITVTSDNFNFFSIIVSTKSTNSFAVRGFYPPTSNPSNIDLNYIAIGKWKN